MVRRFDIVLVTDARLPGGTSASIAEEARAQAAAGYRTGLVHIESPLVRHRMPFSPRLRACLERGDLELVLGDEPIAADLVVLRHPTVAGRIDPGNVPEIRATNRVLVANQAPGMPDGPDASDDQGLRYDATVIEQHVSDWLGGTVVWAPIGPLVRENLAAVAPDLPLRETDWVNVIDVAAWHRPRPGSVHRVPVIGRHSRDDPMKWPATRTELLRVYPASDDVEVHVLGGIARARELLDGLVPTNWVLRPFGSMPPERFLAGIDVYVYYHHPRLVEAFGRTILEAMASGAPAVLPPHFAALFEDAAIYAPPEDAPARVHGLHADRAAYRAASDRGTTFVSERFGHAAHVARVAELAEPSTPARGTSAARHVPAGDVEEAGTALAPSPPRRRVLFVSSNGAGVGHLMRLMAMARTAPDDVEPLFLTFSQGAKVVDDAGYLVEYLASRAISGASPRYWHPLLRDRVNELIERYDIRAVVFDGTNPYLGLLDAVGDHGDVGLVWSRRAMWRTGITNDVLEVESGRFDLILEPGEFAAEEDHGATRRRRHEAVQVPPITYLGADDLLERDQARADLGLDLERPAALVNLGAGNINDTSSLLGMVVERLGQEPELQVCVTRSIIAERAARLPDNVRTISVYPLARYLQAFDLAFAASGYNSYHELLLAGVPTAFVPNQDTATDDQAARSRFAERVGVGVDLPDPSAPDIDRAVRTLTDPDRRRRMHERALARRLDNGAAEAMEAIVELLDEGPGGRRSPAHYAAERAARRARRLAAAQPAGAQSTGTGGAAAAGASGEAPMGADGQPTTQPAGASTAATSATAAAQRVRETAVRGAARARAGARIGARQGQALARQGAKQGRRVVAVGMRQFRRRLAVLVQYELFQSYLLKPYKRLPQPARDRIRRTLLGWQTPQSRALRGARDIVPLPVPRGGALPPLPEGAEPDTELRAVAIVFPATADDTVVAALVDVTAQLQVAYESFAPLIVTSNIDFRPLRRYGYLFEYFPPRTRWGRMATSQPWYAARAARLHTILQRFDVAAVITLPEPDEDGLDALRAQLVAGLDGLTLSR